jgi:hypothetical protein
VDKFLTKEVCFVENEYGTVEYFKELLKNNSEEYRSIAFVGLIGAVLNHNTSTDAEIVCTLKKIYQAYEEVTKKT